MLGRTSATTLLLVALLAAGAHGPAATAQSAPAGGKQDQPGTAAQSEQYRRNAALLADLERLSLDYDRRIQTVRDETCVLRQRLGRPPCSPPANPPPPAYAPPPTLAAQQRAIRSVRDWIARQRSTLLQLQTLRDRLRAELARRQQ